jgi:hypothetical protein
VCTTARKYGGKVHLLFSLSMKRVVRQNGSHVYTIIVGEVQEDGMGTPFPPDLIDLFGDFIDRM